MTAKGEAVKASVEQLFSDTSVEKQVTLDDLEEIAGDVGDKINCLRVDIKQGKARGLKDKYSGHPAPKASKLP